MNLDELIKHYEGQVADHEDGTMMSTGEMVHGRYWSMKILGELRALEYEDSRGIESTGV